MLICRRNFRPKSKRTLGLSWNLFDHFLPNRGLTVVRASKEGKVSIKPPLMTIRQLISRLLPRRMAQWFQRATSSKKADQTCPIWISQSKTWLSSLSSPTRKLSFYKNRFCLLSKDRSSKNCRLKKTVNLR